MISVENSYLSKRYCHKQQHVLTVFFTRVNTSFVSLLSEMLLQNVATTWRHIQRLFQIFFSILLENVHNPATTKVMRHHLVDSQLVDRAKNYVNSSTINNWSISKHSKFRLLEAEIFTIYNSRKKDLIS